MREITLKFPPSISIKKEREKKKIGTNSKAHLSLSLFLVSVFLCAYKRREKKRAVQISKDSFNNRPSSQLPVQGERSSQGALSLSLLNSESVFWVVDFGRCCSLSNPISKPNSSVSLFRSVQLWYRLEVFI